MTKECKQCGKSFEKRTDEGPLYWSKKKYCSNKCAFASPDRKKNLSRAIKKGFKLGRKVWNKGKTGLQVAWNKGDGEYAKKLGFGKWMIGRKGEQSHVWKGEEVGYGALHDWVRRELGSPNKCTHCGKSSRYPQGMHWANKDHKYRRNLNDWIRLCAKCHKEYDKKL